MTQDQNLFRIKNHGLVLYDGGCGFCQFWVQFVLRRDRRKYFLFAPLQARWTKSIHGQMEQSFNTVFYYENERLFQKSRAAARILLQLPLCWKMFGIVLLLVPRPIGDFFYDVVAKNRHRILGGSCLKLTRDEEARFLA